MDSLNLLDSAWKAMTAVLGYFLREQVIANSKNTIEIAKLEERVGGLERNYSNIDKNLSDLTGGFREFTGEFKSVRRSIDNLEEWERNRSNPL